MGEAARCRPSTQGVVQRRGTVGPTATPCSSNPLAVTSMTINWAEFTVAELRGRAGEHVFQSAGADIVDMDGPHEDEWSLYATVSLEDGQQLETILHHRAGKPLSGDCTCPHAGPQALCSHLVWVGLTHLGLDAPPGAALTAETAPATDLRPWLTTLRADDLIDLVIEAADGDQGFRRRLLLRARQP
jgi:hypothetical protein